MSTVVAGVATAIKSSNKQLASLMQRAQDDAVRACIAAELPVSDGETYREAKRLARERIKALRSGDNVQAAALNNQLEDFIQEAKLRRQKALKGE